MIDGVKIKNLRVIPDERGHLMEVLRNDEELFLGFGQTYVTTTYPGVVKGWHLHKEQIDHVVCLKGMIKLVLFDDRDESPTRGEINEFFIGELNPKLIQIPKLIYHGWKCISTETAYIMNVPNQAYNYNAPDEVRLAAHNNGIINYQWDRQDR